MMAVRSARLSTSKGTSYTNLILFVKPLLLKKKKKRKGRDIINLKEKFNILKGTVMAFFPKAVVLLIKLLQ